MSAFSVCFLVAMSLSPSIAFADPDQPRLDLTAPLSPPLPRSRTWPLAVSMQAMIGVEPHAQGAPLAFGVGAELLWRARVGAFASVLSSEGSPVLVTQTTNGKTAPSLADRISLPFGLAARPFAWWVGERAGWLAAFAEGVGLQLGATVENLRTGDDDRWIGGLHVALLSDVPLSGSPVAGGLALRVMLRGLVTPSVTLSQNAVFEPVASLQFYAGLSYYP